MEAECFLLDDFDTWLDESGIKLSKDDDQKIMDLMSDWYDLDGDLQQKWNLKWVMTKMEMRISNGYDKG